jgi:hypothetical protein
MHRRETRSKRFLQDRPRGCSRDSALVHADRERSRPEGDRSSLRVSPTAALARGSLHRNGGELGLMIKLSYGVTLRAEGLGNTGLGVLSPPKRLSDLAASQ